MLLALSGCATFPWARPSGEAVTTGETTVAPEVPPTASPAVEDAREPAVTEERLGILAAQVESLAGRGRVLEARIAEVGQETRDQMARERAGLDRSLDELGSRVDRLRIQADGYEQLFAKSAETLARVNESVTAVNASLLALQKDVARLQAYQQEVKASLEKEISEEKLAVFTRVERVFTDRLKVFVDEAGRQAARTAEIEKGMKAAQEQLRAELEGRIVAAGQGQAGYTDRKLAPVLAEVVRQESRVAGMEARLSSALKKAESTLLARDDAVYRDIEGQLGKKFQVILDELARQEKTLARLAEDQQALARDMSGRPREGDLAAMLAGEEADLRAEYGRRLDRQLVFYARLKELLEGITANESAIATLQGRLESGPEALPAARGYRIHLVKRGDTLWDLGRRYGTTVAELRRLNGLRPGEMLAVGQALKVPVPDAEGGT